MDQHDGIMVDRFFCSSGGDVAHPRLAFTPLWRERQDRAHMFLHCGVHAFEKSHH